MVGLQRQNPRVTTALFLHTEVLNGGTLKQQSLFHQTKEDVLGLPRQIIKWSNILFHPSKEIKLRLQQRNTRVWVSLTIPER